MESLKGTGVSMDNHEPQNGLLLLRNKHNNHYRE